MTPVENQRQYVELEIVVLQSWPHARCTGLSTETTNLHTNWHPVCRIWRCLLCPGTFKLWPTRVQRHRDGPVFFSVVNVWRAHPHARIQFCTLCPGLCFTMSSRRESVETSIRISSHEHVINTVSWVCGASALDAGDTREGGRRLTRRALRTRRNRNVRKRDQNMKIATFWMTTIRQTTIELERSVTQLREKGC